MALARPTALPLLGKLVLPSQPRQRRVAAEQRGVHGELARLPQRGKGQRGQRPADGRAHSGAAPARGDLAVFRTAGAYGATMASSYNSRGFVAEVLVDGNKAHLIRQRESAFDTFALEQLVG